MRSTALTVVALFALSSCGQVSQIEAVAACTEKLESVFPAARGLSDQDIAGDIEDFDKNAPNGDFSFVIRAPDGSIFWTCKGNVEARRIDEVSFERLVKKPTNAQVWSY